jgi:hypothetical protein
MDEQHSDLDELQGSGFGVETWSKVIELRRSHTALKVNPNQIARALHRRRARNMILGISASTGQGRSFRKWAKQDISERGPIKNRGSRRRSFAYLYSSKA